MSRYCGDVDPEPIFRAAEHWRTQALRGDGSVLSEKTLWRLEHLEAIDRYYVNNVDETDRTFLEKLKEQLTPTTPETKELVAEMLWVMLLCPSNVTAEKKREDVNLVWGWSGQALSPDLQWLGTQALRGVGSAGQSFSYNRWRELIFFVRFMLAFKRLDPSERDRLLGDGWALAEWLRKIPEEESRQLRHMILFLLFPDQFERVLREQTAGKSCSHLPRNPRPWWILSLPLRLIGNCSKFAKPKRRNTAQKNWIFICRL